MDHNTQAFFWSALVMFGVVLIIVALILILTALSQTRAPPSSSSSSSSSPNEFWRSKRLTTNPGNLLLADSGRYRNT